MTRCLLCSFASDDPDEATGHLTAGHHPKGCGCGPCRVIYGDRGRDCLGFSPETNTAVDWHAFDVWLEGAA